MSQLKTRQNNSSVAAFIAGIEDRDKQKDCRVVMSLMREATGRRARMWGNSIVGFGSYHYRYKSGREGDWFVTGFSPRKQNLTIYIMPGFSKYDHVMKKLGKHKVAKSCLYIKSLADVDIKVLTQLIAQSVKDMARLYPGK